MLPCLEAARAKATDKEEATKKALRGGRKRKMKLCLNEEEACQADRSHWAALTPLPQLHRLEMT